MSTIRVQRRARFATIDRRTVNDERLSYRARGVLLWLLDKPDNWHGSADAIGRAGPEGRDAVRKALAELAEHGYLRRERLQGADGRWSTVTTVYERPQPTQGDLLTTPTDDGLPGVGEPAVGEPAVGIPGPKSLELVQETGTEHANPAAAPPTVAAAAPVASPLTAAADACAAAEWERRTAVGEPQPVGGFVPFRLRCREVIAAGHTPAELTAVLPGMTTFTRGSFEHALRGHGGRPRAGARIDTDRSAPSGQVAP